MKRKIITTFGILAITISFGNLLIGWVDKPSTTDPVVVKQAAAKSLVLLQKSGYVFVNNNERKCASCHHNTLTAMAAELARQKGVPLTDSLAASNVKAMETVIADACNPNQINRFISGANFIIPYVLLGMSAEKYAPSLHTDIAVDYIMSQAKPDGSFLTESGRIPLETGVIHLTALAIRSIQLYASPAKKQQVDDLVKRTKQWLEKQVPNQQQELAFQLAGLQWCGSSTDLKAKVFEKLKSMQNKDGGWSQLPTLKSDAYATGQTLFAMYESGMAKPEDEVYQKGVEYLLKTQTGEGAWVVKTRSFPIQPYIETDFPPYDYNQFISATASNWATIALLNTLPDKKN
jgi:hypothetical protein